MINHNTFNLRSLSKLGLLYSSGCMEPILSQEALEDLSRYLPISNFLRLGFEERDLILVGMLL